MATKYKLRFTAHTADPIRETALRHAVKDYRWAILSHLNWVRYEEMVYAIAELAPEGGDILELGCGVGYAAAMLAAIRKDLKVTATDIEAFPSWDSFSAYGCRFRTCDATRTPFESGSFDLVFSIGTMEHVQEEERFLPEVYRCLKEGGLNMMFSLPSLYSLPETISKFIGTGTHEHKYTIKEVKKIFPQAGFRILRVKRQHVIPAQVDRFSRILGKFFNTIYVPLFFADKLLCRTPCSVFGQNIQVVSQKTRGFSSSAGCPISRIH